MPQAAPEASAIRCPPHPRLGKRPLLTAFLASELEDLFKVLANDTRLMLFHSLVRAGELSVTDLAHTVGMKPQAVSNQLQRLVASRVLGSRREGNCVFYRVVYPCVITLLDKALCLIEGSPSGGIHGNGNRVAVAPARGRLRPLRNRRESRSG